jgi:hypothetical protein
MPARLEPDLPSDYYLEYYPDEDEINEFLQTHHDTNLELKYVPPIPAPRRAPAASPLRLIKGATAPDPAPSDANLHLVPLINDSSARVIFHLGVRFIEQAIIKNRTDHTLRDTDIEKVIDRLCQVTP